MILSDGIKFFADTIKTLWLKFQFLPLLLVLSLGFNIFLTRKNVQLDRTLTLIKTERNLIQGAQVSPFSARTTAGVLETIKYSDSAVPTLLYVFEPGCTGCERNWQNIKYLATAGREKCRVIGLSLTPDISKLEEYVAKNELPFPVYCEVPFVVTNKLRMGPTPYTILVSADGKVLKNWVGSYEGNYKKEIEQYFSLTLPGVPITQQ